MTAVRTHIGDAPPFDDMCLVVIERQEKKAASTAETGQTDVVEEVTA